LTELAANIILKKSIFSASFLTVTSLNTHLRCQPAGRDRRGDLCLIPNLRGTENWTDPGLSK
jgi:hypothetical protein